MQALGGAEPQADLRQRFSAEFHEISGEERTQGRVHAEVHCTTDRATGGAHLSGQLFDLLQNGSGLAIQDLACGGGTDSTNTSSSAICWLNAGCAT